MAQPWPAQLQDFINEDSFGLQMGDTVLISQNDYGPPKRRRRFTEGIDVFGVTIDLHYADYTILKNFVDVTLNGGIEAFEYDHPITQVASEFKLIGVPSVSRLGGEWFRVAMKWELQN